MDTLTLSTAFKMVVSLGVVLMSFGGAVWVAKRVSARGRILGKKINKGISKPLEILSFQSFGPGKNIYLIRCLDKKILIGVTNAQITSLGNIEEEMTGADDFQNSYQEKLPDQTEKRLKEHFDTSLKEVSRV